MRAVAQEDHVVTDANLNEKVKNAKTEGDHEMIAEYYDKEAADKPAEGRTPQNYEKRLFQGPDAGSLLLPRQGLSTGCRLRQGAGRCTTVDGQKSRWRSWTMK
jgi:hypothetical protein